MITNTKRKIGIEIG